MAEITLYCFFLTLGLENHQDRSPSQRLINISAEHFITALIQCSFYWEWEQRVKENITSCSLVFEIKRQNACSQFFVSEYWQYRLILQNSKVVRVVYSILFYWNHILQAILMHFLSTECILPALSRGLSLEDGFHHIGILHKTSPVIICRRESKNKALPVKSPSCRVWPVFAQCLLDPSTGPQSGFLASWSFCSPPMTSSPSFTTPYSNVLLLKEWNTTKKMGYFYSLSSELNSWKINQRSSQWRNYEVQ